MTIVRPSTTQPGSSGEEIVPAAMKRERLAAQIAFFERAGYRHETTAGLQAIVTRPRERSHAKDVVLTVLTVGLWLVPRASGRARSWHRVVITVDDHGVVRYR